MSSLGFWKNACAPFERAFCNSSNVTSASSFSISSSSYNHQNQSQTHYELGFEETPKERKK